MSTEELKNKAAEENVDYDSDDDVDSRPGASRAEQKAQKAIMKLGAQKLTGIYRVALRRGRNAIFVVDDPVVYKVEGSFVFFGDMKIDDSMLRFQQQQRQMAAQQQFRERAAAAAPAAAPAEAEEEDVEVDTNGLDDNDIQLVMSEASTTKSKAVAALRAADGDLVKAIMSLVG